MAEVSSWLREWEQSGKLRQLRPIHHRGGGQIQFTASPGETWLDFSSNDYLALSEHPAVMEGSRQALSAWGAGAGAARLMSGDLVLCHRLEEEIAQLKGQEGALLFGSGYMANVGVIPALVGRGDVIFADRLSHASIVDGCRLSGARFRRFRHNDLGHLKSLLLEERGRGRALIVVESIYSMDGDRCPLRDLVNLKDEFSCQLLVDEAHATGVFGPRGGGIIEEDGVGGRVDLALGTFGKALGSYGAYVAASGEMIRYLQNRARSFIYSTALPPAVLGASLAAVNLVGSEPALRRELHQKVALFKDELRQGGFQGTLGPSQIIPVVVGGSRQALALAAELHERHVFATAVRPPTVPSGAARLRFSITRHHSEDSLRETARVLLAAIRRRQPELLA